MNFYHLSNMSSTGITPNMQETFPDYVEIPIKLIYVVLTLAGICGNGLVLFLIAAKRVERTVFNTLLVNLSCADIIADISLYPYIFVDLREFNTNPLQGRLLCNFTVGLTVFFTCTGVSLQTLTIISVNRYMCINHPLRFEWQQGRKSALCSIPVTWLISTMVMVPNYVSFVHKSKWGVCKREWPQSFNGTAYTLITSLLGLLAPMIVLVYTYTATVITMRSRRSEPRSGDIIRVNRQKTVRLLGWLIVLFSVCWVPFFIYWVLSRAVSIFSEGYNGDYQRMRAIRLTIIAAAANTVADPVIYALFSERYRTALRMLFNRNSAVEPLCNIKEPATSIVYANKRFGSFYERSSFSTQDIDAELNEREEPHILRIMNHIRNTDFTGSQIQR